MVLWALIATAVAGEDGVLDRVAAVVDDNIVALSEIYELGADFIEKNCSQPFGKDRCIYEAELEILDVLIKRALIQQELIDLHLTVASTEIDQAIDSIVRDYGMEDRTALRKEVEASGLDWSAYRSQIREQLRVQRFQQRVLMPRVSVSDDELKDLYDRTARGEQSAAVTLDALGMVLPPEDEAIVDVALQAQELVKALNAGETSWEDARSEYDAAGVSAALGQSAFKKGQLTPELDAVVFDADVNTFLDPIRVGGVLMVVRVSSREMIEGEVRPFKEVAPALKNQLLQEKVKEAEEVWYQRARRQSAVKVLLAKPS